MGVVLDPPIYPIGNGKLDLRRVEVEVRPYLVGVSHRADKGAKPPDDHRVACDTSIAVEVCRQAEKVTSVDVAEANRRHPALVWDCGWWGPHIKPPPRQDCSPRGGAARRARDATGGLGSPTMIPHLLAELAQFNAPRPQLLHKDDVVFWEDIGCQKQEEGSSASRIHSYELEPPLPKLFSCVRGYVRGETELN